MMESRNLVESMWSNNEEQRKMFELHHQTKKQHNTIQYYGELLNLFTTSHDEKEILGYIVLMRDIVKDATVFDSAPQMQQQLNLLYLHNHHPQTYPSVMNLILSLFVRLRPTQQKEFMQWMGASTLAHHLTPKMYNLLTYVLQHQPLPHAHPQFISSILEYRSKHPSEKINTLLLLAAQYEEFVLPMEVVRQLVRQNGDTIGYILSLSKATLPYCSYQLLESILSATSALHSCCQLQNFIILLKQLINQCLLGLVPNLINIKNACKICEWIFNKANYLHEYYYHCHTIIEHLYDIEPKLKKLLAQEIKQRMEKGQALEFCLYVLGKQYGSLLPDIGMDWMEDMAWRILSEQAVQPEYVLELWGKHLVLQEESEFSNRVIQTVTKQLPHYSQDAVQAAMHLLLQVQPPNEWPIASTFSSLLTSNPQMEMPILRTIERFSSEIDVNDEWIFMMCDLIQQESWSMQSTASMLRCVSNWLFQQQTMSNIYVEVNKLCLQLGTPAEPILIQAYTTILQAVTMAHNRLQSEAEPLIKHCLNHLCTFSPDSYYHGVLRPLFMQVMGSQHFPQFSQQLLLFIMQQYKTNPFLLQILQYLLVINPSVCTPYTDTILQHLEDNVAYYRFYFRLRPMYEVCGKVQPISICDKLAYVLCFRGCGRKNDTQLIYHILNLRIEEDNKINSYFEDVREGLEEGKLTYWLRGWEKTSVRGAFVKDAKQFKRSQLMMFL